MKATISRSTTSCSCGFRIPGISPARIENIINPPIANMERM